MGISYMQTRNLVNTLLLVAIVCLVVWSVAQSRPVAVAAAVPEQVTTGSISVSGSSAIRVPPDRVVVVFGIETYAVTPRASQTQNARASRQVLDAIEAEGVNARDIATAHFTLQPKYDDTYL